MVKYPGQIDNSISLPTLVDNFTPVTGDSVNRLRDAILAIENELGVKPSGVYSTVRNRLDVIENLFNLDIVSLNGDLGGTTQSPLVIGLQNRPIDPVEPNAGQVLGWTGIVWQPQDLSVNLTVLPTHVLLPTDINFLNTDGYSNSSSPTRVGARKIDMSLYPASYPDGRNRTLTFKASLEVTNAITDGYVRLKDVTNNSVITGTLLQTNSLTSSELEVVINSGTTDGYLRTDAISMYEVQIYVTGGGGSDQVICRNARIEVSYSSPILVTALVPLALPVDIQFIAGTTLNGFNTPASVGGRKLDMSNFPLTLPDNRVRHMFFYADVEVSTSGMDGYLQLFDTTNNVAITNSLFHFTNTIGIETVSSELTVGSASGNIRNDAATRYEVRMWKVSGSSADRVICNNARLTILYY